LGIFFHRFGVLYQEKSGNPVSDVRHELKERQTRPLIGF
jgi:hypothetical protein